MSGRGDNSKAKPGAPVDMEPLRRAITGCVRSIAGDAEVEVAFANERPGMTGERIRLPELSKRPTAHELAVTRGLGDSMALRLACHDARVHAVMAPQGADARSIFDAVEQARVESIGSLRMSGVAANINSMNTEKYAKANFSGIERQEDAPIGEAMAMIVREKLTGQKPPESAGKVLDLWRPFIEEKTGGELDSLLSAINDQQSFARVVRNMLSALGIASVGFTNGIDAADVEAATEQALQRGSVGMIFVETPANPTSGLIDLRLMATTADAIATHQGRRPLIAVDNTLLGPMFQHPLHHGVDLALYSLTKYAGGHSDLIAGGVTGGDANVRKIVQTRGAIGTQLDPNSCWMLLRSLETLQIRAERACTNARHLADYLRGHHKIAKVDYLGFLADDDPRKAVFERQSTAPGSTFSFDIKGGEREAFAFLDKLSVCKLAVSLGGTETLICHPASTTHSGVSKELREEIGLSDALIRISVGIENPDDLIADLDQALR